jgi:hypothetical protein
VTGREGKSRAEFTFVDVEICAADPAGVNPEKDFIALDFWDRNIPIFEFTRGIVNNCFHNEINKPAMFWPTGREETWDMFVVKVNKVKQLLKIFLSWLEKGQLFRSNRSQEIVCFDD